jgi:hypothetical protein
VHGKPQIAPFKYQRSMYVKPHWRVNGIFFYKSLHVEMRF